MQTIINAQAPEFKVQAFQNGEFKTVSSDDIKGPQAIITLFKVGLIKSLISFS